IRWGSLNGFLPSRDLTDDGAASYWAEVQLDRSRDVSAVRMQMRMDGGDTVRRFFLDGSNDGTSWSQIGSVDYGAFYASGSPPPTHTTHNGGTTWNDDVSVTPGTWRYVRTRFMAGDYTWDGAIATG